MRAMPYGTTSIAREQRWRSCPKRSEKEPGQKALVVGATSGIGRLIATYFAGATIAVDGGRNGI
jgi:hypothetical protein